MNEAAERTRERLGVFYRDPIERPLYEAASRDLDEALAAERRATVERIRSAYMSRPAVDDPGEEMLQVLAILEEEAAR